MNSQALKIDFAKALMGYMIYLLTKCLITEITAIWAPTSMCAPCYHVIRKTNDITHISRIWQLTTVYMLMC